MFPWFEFCRQTLTDEESDVGLLEEQPQLEESDKKPAFLDSDLLTVDGELGASQRLSKRSSVSRSSSKQSSITRSSQKSSQQGSSPVKRKAQEAVDRFEEEFLGK
jgi:hypothetical protein